MNKPLVYLILGAEGSGRGAIVEDLIEGGLAEEDIAVVLRFGEDGWKMNGADIDASIPPGATHAFFITDGRKNPVDQVEAFVAWLPLQGAELGRIITVVDCKRAEKHPALLAWYEACIHFSDVVLLNRREGVDNKWLSNFLAHFKKAFVPSLFEYVKGGKVPNPALVLAPQARRVSHAFDETDWIAIDELGEETSEEDQEDDEELEMKVEEDPYFARSDAGRRMKEIPDINKYPGEGS